MSDDYIPLITPPEALTEPALWFAFRKAEILVVSGAEQPALPCCLDISEHGVLAVRHQYLGLYGGKHCYAVALDESQTLPDGWSALGLRDLFGLVDTTLAVLSGRAYQLLEWDRNHQYCSRCGTPTQLRTDERSRTCPACGFTSYPPVSPAIMILVTHQGKLLLARKAAFPKGRYSALAGFVEPVVRYLVWPRVKLQASGNICLDLRRTCKPSRLDEARRFRSVAGYSDVRI